MTINLKQNFINLLKLLSYTMYTTKTLRILTDSDPSLEDQYPYTYMSKGLYIQLHKYLLQFFIRHINDI